MLALYLMEDMLLIDHENMFMYKQRERERFGC